MKKTDYEASIKACYSTWGDNYYDDYYTNKAAYPPVHRALIQQVLHEANAHTVLDAGCGPASILRDLDGAAHDRYGFDLTPEMVEEARRVMQTQGVSVDHIWEGSVTDPQAFKAPSSEASHPFDAALCIGVLPHIPEEADATVIENLRDAVRTGGVVILEARNQLFSLFTLNRYSHDFFLEELVQVDALRAQAGDQQPALDRALAQVEAQFRMDIPPVRKGKKDEPGYDEVLSRTHNPHVLKAQFEQAGFRDVRTLFYHYHALPPMCEAAMPAFFRKQSLAMEHPEDWRGYYMASAFLLVGRRA